ncbi:MAG: AAA family ATPase [Chloroflexi bacterium]|nr:AAA family ATPase [Chloroflexota bacterium]
MENRTTKTAPYIKITDDLDALLDILPPHISDPLRHNKTDSELLEVVIDLGRKPEARFLNGEIILTDREITIDDIEYITSRISPFGDDNRAGIERTLHRISAFRNRKGRIIGLTCRVGRAIFGTIKIIEDLIQSGKSTLLLGAPGVGKTTMLREVARVLAENKRVIVVDTSNEIAGDGDIPHPAIGHARRMQVPTPTLQHAVMIEAVENHMPEVIIIDEIGTELETTAARTIAERGVQLVATAHGTILENLVLNPTLSDLIGGIQTVTLSDEEAKRRHTQKSILERKAPPTFDIVVEIQHLTRVAVHLDSGSVVDELLRGNQVEAEIRYLDKDGKVKTEHSQPTNTPVKKHISEHPVQEEKNLYPFGLSRSRLLQVIKDMQLPLNMVDDFKDADLVMTTKSSYKKNPQLLRAAETARIPVYVIRSNTALQIEHCLSNLYNTGDLKDAMTEAESALKQVMDGQNRVELAPQNSYIRRLQHQLASHFNLASQSTGQEPHRRVSYFQNNA